MRAVRVKNLRLTILKLVITALCAIFFTGCPLEDNEALWEELMNEKEGSSGIVPGSNLTVKLEWLKARAKSNGEYILEVNADENISQPQTLLNNRSNVTITLRGVGSTRTVSISPGYVLFTVRSGVTLVLDNITLQQSSDSYYNELVSVYSGGTLVMNSGSSMIGSDSVVSMESGGTFTMSGGTISGIGTRVYVNGGTFTMSGGTISGGGVSVGDYGTFTMSGGTISGIGTGVYVNGGTFTMNNGTISGNSDSGVFVRGTFTMSGGIISGNSTNDRGGGVYVYDGTFIMNGGAISGNSASNSGGGVYVADFGTFTKAGGAIYGYSVGDTVNSNVVKNSSGVVLSSLGHAVYVDCSPAKCRETTAGPSINLNSAVAGTAGGWENVIILGSWLWDAFNDVYNGGTSSVTISESSGTISLSGNVTTVYEYGFVAWQAYPNATELAKLKTATSISFKVRGDGKTYKIILPISSVTDYAYHTRTFTAGPTETTITVNISSFTQPEWGYPQTLNKNLLEKIQWQTADGASGPFWLMIRDLTLDND